MYENTSYTYGETSYMYENTSYMYEKSIITNLGEKEGYEKFIITDFHWDFECF
jgi:hypothetical protein